MLNYNDLIGLEYKWGAHPLDGAGCTDCFALTMEIRRRMGLHDFYPDFRWMYDAYDAEKVPGQQILKWIWANGVRIKEPKVGAIFRGPSFSNAIALAGIVSPNEALMIGPKGKVIVVPFAKVAKGLFYWAE